MPRIIIVSTSGSDSNQGTLDQPFASLAHAVAVAQPGDTIQLRGGDYAGGVRIQQPNITIEAYQGEKVVISSPNTAGSPDQVIHFDINSDGGTLRGVEVSGGEYYCVKLESAWDWGPTNFQNAATNITIENCILHDAGRDIIKMTPGCDNARILNNEIYNSGMREGRNAEGIDCVNCDNTIVRGNYIHDTATTGAYFKGGSQGTIFEYNVVERTGRTHASGQTANSAEGVSFGYETDSEWFDADNTGFVQHFGGTIQYNIIRDVPGSGIMLAGAHGALVTNNTLHNVAFDPNYFYGGITITNMRCWVDGGYVYSLTEDATVVNNIVTIGADPDTRPGYYGNHALYALQRASGNGFAGEMNVNNNIYYALDGHTDGLFGGGDGAPTLAQWQATLGWDTSSRVVDPGLDANAHLASGSAAIDHGLAVGANVDFDGNSISGTKDIGADEFRAGPSLALPKSGQAGIGRDLSSDDTPDTTAPAAVTALTSEAYSGGGIFVRWQTPDTGDGLYYQIYGNGRLLDTTTTNAYWDRHSTGTVDYTVVAFDKGNNQSVTSQALRVDLGGPQSPPPPPPGTSPPPPPAPLPQDPPPDAYDFAALASAVDGVVGVWPAPGASNVDPDATLAIKLAAAASFGWTSGVIKIVRDSDGAIMGSVDFEPGDAQEGRSVLEIDMSAFDLAPGTAYSVTAGHLFARVNAAPWNATAIDSGQWRFTTAGDAPAQPPAPTPEPPPVSPPPPPPPVEPPPVSPPPPPPPVPTPEPPPVPAPQPEFAALANPVNGVVGVWPAPGASNVDPDATLAIKLAAASSFGWTSGVVNIVRVSDGAVMATVDFEPGHAQEGQSILSIDLSSYNLAPNTQYAVTAGHLFARVNAAPWSASAIENGQWLFTTADAPPPTLEELDFGALAKPVDTVIGVWPTPGASNVELDATLAIRLAATSNFSYTNGVINIIRDSDGEVVATIDFEPGDEQEGNSILTIDLSAYDLMPETKYSVTAGHLFTRVNIEPWNATAIEAGQWSFTTAQPDFASLSAPVKAVVGVWPTPGATDVDPDAFLAIKLAGTSNFGWTGGVIQVVRESDGTVMGTVDFEPGDAQEGKSTLYIDLDDFDLAANTTYSVVAGHLFTRVNTDPWNASAIQRGVWTFTTGDDDAMALVGQAAPADPGLLG